MRVWYMWRAMGLAAGSMGICAARNSPAPDTSAGSVPKADSGGVLLAGSMVG